MRGTRTAGNNDTADDDNDSAVTSANGVTTADDVRSADRTAVQRPKRTLRLRRKVMWIWPTLALGLTIITLVIGGYLLPSAPSGS